MRQLLFLFTAAIAFAQSAPNPALDRATALLRDYGRGVTENRFDVKVKISTFDTSGALKRVRNTTHRLEFTRGRFRSNEDWEGAIKITTGQRSTVGLQLYADMAIFLPTFYFAPEEDARNKWIFEVASSDGGKLINVRFQSREPCQTFETQGADRFRFHDTHCAAGEITLDEHGSTPMHSRFEARGFPVAVGKHSLKSFQAECDFQNVILPEMSPLVCPARSVTTIEFEDERTQVECLYTLRSGKR